ncbi:MAG: GtrA family protein [Gammaproteobacteria bacterium]|nr:GtrA family protein [Gammaproteobacteria bacterium]
MINPLSLPLVRYLLIGGGNVFVCAFMMRVGALLGLSYLYYTPLGYSVAMLNSFMLNGYFTFEVKGFSLKRLGQFFLINGVNLGFVELIEYVLISWLLMPEYLAVLYGMCWYTIVGFLLNRRIVFHDGIQKHDNQELEHLRG